VIATGNPIQNELDFLSRHGGTGSEKD